MPKRIVVVGICTVDAIGQFVDEYPQRQGLVFFDRLSLTTGGNAVNCTIALRKLGLDCEVVIKVGRDIFGEHIARELAACGVGTRGLIRGDDAGTPFSFVCAHADGERSFIHTPGTNATLRLEEIPAEVVESAELFFLTGSMLMPTLDGAPSAELLRRARAAGAVTLLDTVFANTLPPEEWRRRIDPCLPHVDYFVPSRPEAAWLTGHDDPAAMADELAARGCRNVIIKLGEAGAYVRPAEGKPYCVPAYRVPRIVDATGAGDTWCAGFLAGLALGDDVPAAVRLGHAVAAHCVQATGASTGIPTLDAVRAFQRTA
jgi:sugar/nucleoside kinase (ribokinase family)